MMALESFPGSVEITVESNECRNKMEKAQIVADKSVEMRETTPLLYQWLLSGA
jgi:hypothetical protein